MARPKSASKIRKTPNFDFIFGSYNFSACKIPYFQISMSFSDASSYLRLVSEMPGAASMDWKIEELFQRDVDWKRVEKSIVPYIKNRSQPQFFNSLTIALLPVIGDEIATFDGAHAWSVPALESEKDFVDGQITQFGPITCGYWNKWNEPGDEGARLGQLCWNTEQICGVAIDGQHRLAAIKTVTAPGSEVYADSSVPVIFVVLDEKLGYSGPSDRAGIVEILRRLFIDLNKHAKTVNRARQILLDDRDPASICVRALVGSALTTGDKELRETPPTLPLSLVDWHSEQAKFDKGPYLTTILGVDWIVSKTLNIKPFNDMMAFDKIEKLITRLESKLAIDLPDARTRLQECRTYERPFSFSDEPIDELEIIGNGFSRQWSPALTHIFAQFAPYKKLIETRLTERTLAPEFANWFALRQRADDSGKSQRAAQLLADFESHLAGRSTDPIGPGELVDALGQAEKIKGNGGLAFLVVFQRALFEAFLKYCKITQPMLDGIDPGGGDVNLDEEGEILEDGDDSGLSVGVEFERAEEFIQGLNLLIRNEPEVLKPNFEFAVDGTSASERLWICSFVQPDSSIDFSQSASNRAADLILSLVIFYVYQNRQKLGRDDFDELLERIEDSSGGLDLKLKQCLDRMWTRDNSIAARILVSREQDFEDDETRWQPILCRSQWLWDALLA